jgi:hypothetical protein
MASKDGWVKHRKMSGKYCTVWHKRKHSLSVCVAGDDYSVALHSGKRYKYQGRFNSKKVAYKKARELMQKVR